MKRILYDVLRKPLVTEKATLGEDRGIFTFVIDGDATKVSVKKAVEHLFGVDVKKVNIINVFGKKKVFKGRVGKRCSLKKAIVVTKDARKIQFSNIG